MADYAQIRAFAEAHHTLAIAPKLIIDSNDIAGYFDGDEYLN